MQIADASHEGGAYMYFERTTLVCLSEILYAAIKQCIVFVAFILLAVTLACSLIPYTGCFNSYPHVSASFCTFIFKFQQMALIFPRVPIVFTLSSFDWMQTLCEQRLREKVIISGETLTKGESWALLTKSAVESTTLAQPFCVNQAVGLGDQPGCQCYSLQRLHVQFVVRCKTIFPLVGPTEL